MEDRLTRTESNTRNFSHGDGEDQFFGVSENHLEGEFKDSSYAAVF